MAAAELHSLLGGLRAATDSLAGKGAVEIAPNALQHCPPLVSSKQSQCLAMGSERFMVPEALFHPSEMGLPQAGMAEVVTQAVSVRLSK
jgi:hypothetical protein